MPSGHAETITIICTLLYNYKYINLDTCIFIILVISLQRVISQKHTITQVLFGNIIGLLYSLLYVKLSHNLFIGIFTVILLGFLLLLLILIDIDLKVHEPVPKWIDKNIIPIIEKKQNISIVHKIISLYNNCIDQNTILYISWKKLEDYLDILITKIKETNIKFDAVVGIKSGGAIISDYVSKKLGLLNYKIKIKNNSNDNSFLFHNVKKNILKNYGNNIIIEGIDDDLLNKNIILLDENVDSGMTMYSAIKYLKSKKINIVKPYCICYLNKTHKKFDKYKIDYVTNDEIIIWPWGYDN
jgi:hypoxanthine phosphoribosyltransferase